MHGEPEQESNKYASRAIAQSQPAEMLMCYADEPRRWSMPRRCRIRQQGRAEEERNSVAYSQQCMPATAGQERRCNYPSIEISPHIHTYLSVHLSIRLSIAAHPSISAAGSRRGSTEKQCAHAERHHQQSQQARPPRLPLQRRPPCAPCPY